MSGHKAKDAYHHGDLRSALIDAAVELLEEHGLSGLSLRECARRVGVSHAAPYRHFADKDALLLAIAKKGFERLAAAGRAAMVGLEDPVDRLDAYGVAYVRFALDHPQHHRVMFASELAPGDPAEDRVNRGPKGDGAFSLLLECVADVHGGEGDVMVAAVAFWSLVHGLSMLILDGRIPREHIETPAQVEALTRACYASWRATAR